MLDYREQRCQITEVVLYTKVLVNDILVRLERILDYAGVGLERFNCTDMTGEPTILYQKKRITECAPHLSITKLGFYTL